MPEYPGRLYHNTPGWVSDGALFHVRIRADAAQPSLNEPKLAAELLAAARRYHDLGHWWCELFLVMPDHLHAILAFPRQPGMTNIIRNWKRGTNRFQRVHWQEGFYDHRLRNEAEVREKWGYVRRNPVAKNLCATDDQWRDWWSVLDVNPLLQVERLDLKPLD